MAKYALLIAYDGTSFCGWQKQSGKEAPLQPSIQATVEEAVSKVTQEERSIVGSGRTDSGVHARGQVAHLVLENKVWDVNDLKNGLNALLPEAIRIQAVKSVYDEFHAQRSAEKKQYSYYFQEGACALPHLARYSWWRRRPLNVGNMCESLQPLLGKHDFKPFQGAKAADGSTVREIFEIDVQEIPIGYPAGDFGSAASAGPITSSSEYRIVRFRVVGSGFLKQMVRGMVGTLLQVAEGKLRPGIFEQILDSQDRSLLGPTAPARGLWLEAVQYGDLSW